MPYGVGQLAALIEWACHDQHDLTSEATMITQTSAVTFRQNLGEMLNQVQYRQDSIVINKDGKPVAALVDARLFERIRRMQGRFDALCQRIEAGFATVAQTDGLDEIDAAVAAFRQSISSNTATYLPRTD
jgi:prevent-host-death family protein